MKQQREAEELDAVAAAHTLIALAKTAEYVDRRAKKVEMQVKVEMIDGSIEVWLITVQQQTADSEKRTAPM